MSATPLISRSKKPAVNTDALPIIGSQSVVASQQSQELFFAVVGPVGAGGSRAMTSLERVCEAQGYQCYWVRASDIISEWASQNSYTLPDPARKTLERVSILQDIGDAMREQDSAQVARLMIREVAKKRAAATGQDYQPRTPISPDGVKRAYLIDSIRHPAEIQLLRRTYGSSFALIGVVCEESERKRRILSKYFTTPEQGNSTTIELVDRFIQRDSDDPEKKHGQHVSDAFFESDFFIDNTIEDTRDKSQLLDSELGRLVSIIGHDRIIRPTIEETAMHHAHSARVRSACMSRQVGAALVDVDGTVLATGTNEAPQAGGGVYGERSATDPLRHHDHRCAFFDTPYCSNNKEQNIIIEDLISSIPELSQIADSESLKEKIRKTRLGSLIEFSRAVHAEMDAILSAGRLGVSTVGTRLFVTTFPCHYCARHIVSAGIYEVQYIEPYPKSLALKLHKDAIAVDPSSWRAPTRSPEAAKALPKPGGGDIDAAAKVLVHPFVGVAPRMYGRAFEKTWQLKNKVTGEQEMRAPEWGSEWASLKVGYPELEALLAG